MSTHRGIATPPSSDGETCWSSWTTTTVTPGGREHGRRGREPAPGRPPALDSGQVPAKPTTSFTHPHVPSTPSRDGAPGYGLPAVAAGIWSSGPPAVNQRRDRARTRRPEPPSDPGRPVPAAGWVPAAPEPVQDVAGRSRGPGALSFVAGASRRARGKPLASVGRSERRPGADRRGAAAGPGPFFQGPRVGLVRRGGSCASRAGSAVADAPSAPGRRNHPSDRQQIAPVRADPFRFRAGRFGSPGDQLAGTRRSSARPATPVFPGAAG